MRTAAIFLLLCNAVAAEVIEALPNDIDFDIVAGLNYLETTIASNEFQPMGSLDTVAETIDFYDTTWTFTGFSDERNVHREVTAVGVDNWTLRRTFPSFSATIPATTHVPECFCGKRIAIIGHSNYPTEPSPTLTGTWEIEGPETTVSGTWTTEGARIAISAADTKRQQFTNKILSWRGDIVGGSGARDWSLGWVLVDGVRFDLQNGVREVVGPGDFNGDGETDGWDLLLWQRGETGMPYSPEDLNRWDNNYGPAHAAAAVQGVPEPTTLLLSVLLLACLWLVQAARSAAECGEREEAK